MLMKGNLPHVAEKSRYLSSLMLSGFDCLCIVTLASLSDLGRLIRWGSLGAGSHGESRSKVWEPGRTVNPRSKVWEPGRTVNPRSKVWSRVAR
jgi:hypothetical protein